MPLNIKKYHFVRFLVKMVLYKNISYIFFLTIQFFLLIFKALVTLYLRFSILYYLFRLTLTYSDLRAEFLWLLKI